LKVTIYKTGYNQQTLSTKKASEVLEGGNMKTKYLLRTTKQIRVNNMFETTLTETEPFKTRVGSNTKNLKKPLIGG